MAKKASKAKNNTKKTRKTSRKKKKNGHLLFKFLFVFAAVIGLAAVIYTGYCYLTLPDIETAVSRTRQPSTTIIAENGNEITTYGNSFAEVIYLEDLPYYVPAAVVDVEDHRFYSHFGFDIIGFTRAMAVNLIKMRYAQGASTITQQVAKNLFLTSEKSIRRKVQELLLAFWLEYKFSKEQILTLYLNRVYLGAGTYGIEAAANKYFGKSSRDLTLKEAAIIAGMLKAPSRYNPSASPERAQARAKVVLRLMFEHGTITETEMEQAINEPLENVAKYKVEGARHFADMVYNEVNAYIGERDQDVYVSTTLDQELQQKAEQILHDMIKKYQERNVTQGAVVVLDHQGAVKALVGGLDYDKSQFNRATQALRQPGSAFKPFVYITALQQGWQPDDLIDDIPVKIGKWQPENADRKTHGRVTLTEALTKSYNLATVNLAERLNRRDIIRNARKMGITTEMPNTPSLALGAAEVKVLDMAAAYTAIANGGYAAWPYAITEIYSKSGIQLYQRDMSEPSRILDGNTVEKITSMLENVINNGTGRRAGLPVFAAGKTGTSQDFRDAWFVGWTDQYVAAVWVGNDDNSPMDKIGGSTLPAEIWKQIMLAAIELNSTDPGHPVKKFFSW